MKSLLGEKTQWTRRRVLYFKPGSAKWMRGDEDNNRICYLPGAGGVAVLRDSIYPFRSGHIRLPAINEDHANLMRKESLILFVRQDDPTPLSLAAGRTNRYQGALFTEAEQGRLRSNTTRTAVTDHKRYGAKGDGMTRLLMLVLVISVFCASATWLMIPIIGLVKG